MVKTIAAAALSAVLITGTAHAGGTAPASMPAEVIVQDTASQDGGILVPALALIFMVFAFTNSG